MPPRHSRHSRAAPEPHARAGARRRHRGRARALRRARGPTHGFLDGFRAWLRVAPAAWTNRKRRSRVVALPLEPRPDEDPSVALPVPRPLPARRAAGPGSASGSAHVETKVPAFYVRMKRCTLSKLARQIPVRYRYSCTGTGNRIRYSTGTGILYMFSLVLR